MDSLFLQRQIHCDFKKILLDSCNNVMKKKSGQQKEKEERAVEHLVRSLHLYYIYLRISLQMSTRLNPSFNLVIRVIMEYCGSSHSCSMNNTAAADLLTCSYGYSVLEMYLHVRCTCLFL